ncbi:MFS transporter [Francisella frigiditurris]|uniref:Sugar (And other) transporter family protein n=1 Tax=Francisella frigiditurris TaxID=1542390 RepID=A0A1J0KV39_9GAMM|nr:MFS transporter [Francisella frigiditurris]APC97555.1 sugar (and other) transporter family protein [Francisella frigiditurris]
MIVNKYQKLVLGLIVLTGLCSGFDIGVISGTLPLIEQELMLSPLQLSQIAGVVFFGALISKFISGFLMDLFGRRNTISLGSFLFAISIVLMILSQSYMSLLLSRLFQGISVGFLLTVIPIYIAEASFVNFRGRATGIFQLSLASGIFIANLLASLLAANYGWRLIFAFAIPLAISLLFVSFIAPFSPAWLYSKGKTALADETNKRLFADSQPSSSIREKIRFVDFIAALRNKTYFFQLILISFLTVLNGFVGINLFISYGPTIFGQVLPNLKIHASDYGSALTLVNLLATVVGIFFVDRVGRRKLAISGLLIAFVFTILTIIALQCDLKIIALIGIIIVVFGGAVGPAVCIWLILSEVLPIHLRGMGISIALVSKALLESIFISSFLELVNTYGYPLIFSFMAGCMLLFAVLVYKFLPEMANKELK